MKTLTLMQIVTLRAYGGEEPVELSPRYSNPDSFVYDREYGLILCEPCCHEDIRALLFAWHQGYENDVDYANRATGTGFNWDMGDKFLSLKGTAYKSSMCKYVLTGDKRNLDGWELECFGRDRVREV